MAKGSTRVTRSTSSRPRLGSGDQTTPRAQRLASRAQFSAPEHTVHESRRRKRRRSGAAFDHDLAGDRTDAPAPRLNNALSRSQRVANGAARQLPARKLLHLPNEILTNIISWLPPSDVFFMQRLSRSLNNLILADGRRVASASISRRYPLIAKCFRLPYPVLQCPDGTRPTPLFNVQYPRYICERIDDTRVCPCPSCETRWKILNIILDLHKFQDVFDSHISFNTQNNPGPDTTANDSLLAAHATVVTRAMTHLPTYAAILEKHLASITRTILRKAHRLRKPRRKASSWPPKYRSKARLQARRNVRDKARAETRLYTMSDADVRSGTDAFLSRCCVVSFPEQPLFRKQYQSQGPWMPLRKWHMSESKHDSEGGRWEYLDQL